LQDIASAFLVTHIHILVTRVKTRRNAVTFTRSLFAGNRPQRLIFDGRFRAIVARGMTYDNTTVIIPTELQCTTECIIVAR